MRAAMLGLLLLPAAATAAAPLKPNILMLAVDDLRPLFGEAFGFPEVRSSRAPSHRLCAPVGSAPLMEARF